MRVSRLLTKTLREVPSEAETVSHHYLLRSGMVHQIAAGVYAYLPLGWKVLRKIENIIREELDSAGAQEIMMPVLQPLELWEKTQRHHAFGKALFTLTDRRDRTLCLGPTHEEVVTELVRHQVRSYRDLPLLIYQLQTKFRDEPRPRAGLMRVREFTMMDLYSFDTNEEALDISYQKMRKAYRNIYERCGLPTLEVEADSGAIGGKDSHEFMVITDTGEDEVIRCTTCEYAANVEKAESIKPAGERRSLEPVEEVATPGMKSIEEVADFLQVPRNRTMKAVFYSADGNLVFAAIRGDLDVNEIKLKNALKCTELQLASEQQVRLAGLVAGSASPVGLTGVKVVADDSITLGTNFVAGANRPDRHLLNVNYPRDFKVDIMQDIAATRAGYACPRCGHVLTSTRGVEVGHIFKLGTLFSNTLGAFFLDNEGRQQPIVMGCYGIGVGRLMAAAIEQNHDDQGIIWPAPLAPYQVYLCGIGMDKTEVATAADSLYEDLRANGVEVLYDDRAESPGIKFNDADLLGIPLRVVISPRTLKQQGAEVKRRNSKESQIMPLDDLIRQLKSWS